MASRPTLLAWLHRQLPGEAGPPPEQEETAASQVLRHILGYAPGRLAPDFNGWLLSHVRAVLAKRPRRWQWSAVFWSELLERAGIAQAFARNIDRPRPGTPGGVRTLSMCHPTKPLHRVAGRAPRAQGRP